jgi:hypothetical protein
MSKENGSDLVEVVVKATGERVVVKEHLVKLNPSAYGDYKPPRPPEEQLEQAAKRLAEAADITYEKAEEIVREAAGLFGVVETPQPTEPVVIVQATPPIPVPPPPARNANKGEWVHYAARRGVDLDAAEAMTRDELADLYLNPDSLNYTPPVDETGTPPPAESPDDADTANVPAEENTP